MMRKNPKNPHPCTPQQTCVASRRCLKLLLYLYVKIFQCDSKKIFISIKHHFILDIKPFIHNKIALNTYGLECS